MVTTDVEVGIPPYQFLGVNQSFEKAPPVQ
jgi:hypothetical protein